MWLEQLGAMQYRFWEFGLGQPMGWQHHPNRWNRTPRTCEGQAKDLPAVADLKALFLYISSLTAHDT